MILSLISVHKVHEDGTISGSWVQDHIGTLSTATEKAKTTEEANGNKLDIAVVPSIVGASSATGCSFPPQRRLDSRRITPAYSLN